MRAPLLALLLLAGCAAPDDGLRTPQRHPASLDLRLDAVLADGTVDPSWGLQTPGAGLPDTLALSRTSLLRWLAAEPGTDTLRANVAATLGGALLCPPCPVGAHCEPCAPDALVLSGLVPGGRVEVHAELPARWSAESLRVGRGVVATLERTGDDPTRLLGLR